jgi:carbon-monoxide dehydrogenase small subunit
MKKKISMRINGKKVEAEVPTNRLLIDYLRYDLGLTGMQRRGLRRLYRADGR